ncbi:MAG: hypothetical protein V7L26_22875 [Nostoc sp.]|uniref:hypothetical protein n=1 Tax=Nostoc sp. TaxID=1180 RepID=UPI002FF9A460
MIFYKVLDDGIEILRVVTRISHKFEMQMGRGAEGRRGGGAEGKEQGTLNSPLLPCSPAQAQALSIGEKSGVSGRRNFPSLFEELNKLLRHCEFLVVLS